MGQILMLYQFLLLLPWETIANIDSQSTFCYEHYNQLNKEWLEHKSLCSKGDETPCCEDKTYSMNRRWEEFHMLCPHLVRMKQSCADWYKNGDKKDGIYTIDPDGEGDFQVRCDMTTNRGGWTVFQRRVDGSQDFYRGWADYKTGFGDLNGEFWLGLDKIHRLSKSGQDVLRVDLADFSSGTRYAEYGKFAVASGADKYKLSVGSYSGNAGDSLTSWHNGMMFTTKDFDNDRRNHQNCAVAFKGAWWYSRCHASNLNGLYLRGSHTSYADGVIWSDWRGQYYSLKKSEMKIRPHQF